MAASPHSGSYGLLLLTQQARAVWRSHRNACTLFSLSAQSLRSELPVHFVGGRATQTLGQRMEQASST
jgi:hypothetical protein